MAGYACFRKDRQDSEVMIGGGGVLLYVRGGE